MSCGQYPAMSPNGTGRDEVLRSAFGARGGRAADIAATTGFDPMLLMIIVRGATGHPQHARESHWHHVSQSQLAPSHGGSVHCQTDRSNWGSVICLCENFEIATFVKHKQPPQIIPVHELRNALERLGHYNERNSSGASSVQFDSTGTAA